MFSKIHCDCAPSKDDQGVKYYACLTGRRCFREQDHKLADYLRPSIFACISTCIDHKIRSQQLILRCRIVQKASIVVIELLATSVKTSRL